MRKILKIGLLIFWLSASAVSAGDMESKNKANNTITYEKALQSYLVRANEGDAVWQMLAGIMYRDGKGTPQNYATAIHWFKLASAQGYEGGQYNLASMYANGKGVAKDYVRAHMWANLSARDGDTDAVKQRDLFESRMTQTQIAEAQKLARECQARNFKNCD